MFRSVIALVFALLTAGPSVAAERCEECSSEEMLTVGELAVTSVRWNAVHYPVYVVNFTDGRVVKVVYANNVNENFDWERDEFEAWGVSVEVEPSVSQYVAEMHAVMPSPIVLTRNSALTAGRGVAVSAGADGGPGSVYDAITLSAHDIYIHNRLTNSLADFRQAWYNIVSVINPVTYFKPSAVPPPVSVVFEDGSYAYYTWAPDTGLWVRIKGSARDRFGNRVPESREDVANGGFAQYIFPNDGAADMTRFVYHLNDLGVSVSAGGGTVTGGGGTRLACTSAGGGSVICKIVQM